MKKVFKVTAYVLGGFLLLIGLAALFFQFRGLPRAEVKAPDLNIQADSAMLARGAMLVHSTCTHCHRGPNGSLEGKFMADAGPLGVFYAPNITHHPSSALSKYSDGELAYLLRTGVKRDGYVSLPYMPRFAEMSDQDLHSIIAYLRSDAPVMEASDKPSTPQQYTLLTKAVGSMMMQTLPYPEKPVVAPPLSEQVAYGRYLVTNVLECYGCHSSSFETNNIAHPEKSEGFLGGGNPIEDEDRNIVLSANITPDPQHGIGSWNADQLVACVKTGRRPDGTMVSSAMPKFSAIPDEEIRAIWAYLQTVPPIAQKIQQAGMR